jgi:hypothetical protein
MADTTTQRTADERHRALIEVVIKLLEKEMPAVIDGLIEDCIGGKISINIDSSGTRANVEFPSRIKRVSAKK